MSLSYIKKVIFLKNLDEKIYMDQLVSFLVERKGHIVCKLKKPNLNKLLDNDILSLMIL